MPPRTQSEFPGTTVSDCAAGALAGETLLAIDVRFDRAAVAGLDVDDASADFDDLDAEFMAGDARVAEERHLAEVAADVGAANADAMDAHHCLAGAGFFRAGDLDALPLLRCLQG